MKLFLGVPINIYDLRMNGFSTETAVCLQTLHYSVLIGAANAFYAQIIHMITCSEGFANHPHFSTRSSYISVRYVVRYRRKVFVWGEMYSYSFTSGKTYLVIQTWRIVKWATTWQNQQSDCAPSEDSDQPGHPPSLIRVFAVRMKKTWVFSYPFSAQRRLWSDWADLICLRWAHTCFVGFVMSWLKWFGYPCYVNCVPPTLFNLSPSIFGGRSRILP